MFAMRYFYAALILLTAGLFLIRPELSYEILATSFVIGGLVMLLPTE